MIWETYRGMRFRVIRTLRTDKLRPGDDLPAPPDLRAEIEGDEHVPIATLDGVGYASARRWIDGYVTGIEHGFARGLLGG